MRGSCLFPLLAGVVFLAGCMAPAAPLTTEAGDPETPAPASAIERLEWRGHVLSDATNDLSHSRPTADLLEAWQQGGFSAEIPEGVRQLELVLEWSGPGAFNMLVHTAHDHETGQMTTYQTAVSADNPQCMRIPAAEIHAGKWEFMARQSQGAVRTDLLLTVLTVGAVATLVEEPHGHDRVREVLEGRNDVEGEPQACVLADAVPGG